MTHTPVLLAAAFIGSTFAAEIVPIQEALVVHEWGTFTSVAGDTGEAVDWAPLNATPDLPCFVNRLGPLNYKSALASVRMETPVLYFYPQREMTLSVHVGFPQGWITEWYPQATSVTPQLFTNPNLGSYRGGQIAWEDLRLSPGENPELPMGKRESRYYAARHTDAAPLSIAGQHEKMIFYRGIGNFEIPLRATYDSQGALQLRNTGTDAVPMAMWFENDEGRIGYRLLRDLKDRAAIQPLQMTGSLDELRSSLAQVLVENGLYPKEAAAMIETWRDSWFEAGARIIYIVPRSKVEAVLPLNVTPAATSLSRVFVGRIEVLSPALRRNLETALATGDVSTLARSGRFLYPFMNQIRGSNPQLLASPTAAKYLGEASMKVGQAISARCIE